MHARTLWNQAEGRKTSSGPPGSLNLCHHPPCHTPAVVATTRDLIEHIQTFLYLLPILSRQQKKGGWVWSTRPLSQHHAGKPFRILHTPKPNGWPRLAFLKPMRKLPIVTSSTRRTQQGLIRRIFQQQMTDEFISAPVEKRRPFSPVNGASLRPVPVRL